MNDRHPTRFVMSLFAVVAVTIAAPIALLAASRARFGSGNPLDGVRPPWEWGTGASSDLNSPLADDTVIDAIIRASLCVVWVAIAVIAATIAIELIHALRHRGLPLPDVRGLGWAQRIARSIVAGLIVVLPMTTPATSLASTLEARTPAAAISSSALDDAGHSAATSRQFGPDSFRQDRTAALAPDSPSTSTRIHVVAANESIYSIAMELAGNDTARVIEIADAIIDANLDAPMPGGQRFTNPAYIEVGMALQIPHAATGATPSGDAPHYVVEPGDTLWDIADDELGDPTAWPEIWERNAGNDMGDGRNFDDPHLILPGWHLDLTDDTPDTTAHDAPHSADEATAAEVADTERAPADPMVEESPVEPASPIASSSPDAVLPSTTDAPSAAASSLPASAPSTSPADTAATSATAPASTVPPLVDAGTGTHGPGVADSMPQAPAPIRLEHAALLAAGILALVGVRRRQRLRSAMPRHRVPRPHPDASATERRLRTVDAGERALRVDVACRAAAWSLIDTGSQIGWITASADGALALRLTGAATLPAPWTGGGHDWALAADVPIELLGDDARRVGQPCVALVQVGVTADGDEVILDLEACGKLAIAARADHADDVVTALATSLAASMFAEVAHLVGVSLPPSALLDHRNAHITDSGDAALELAMSLSGTTTANERTSFELRSLRTGGEVWEPAVVLLRSDDDGASVVVHDVVGAGHGLVVVAADPDQQLHDVDAHLTAGAGCWSLRAFGTEIELTPIGISVTELAAVTDLLVDASQELEPIDNRGPVDSLEWTSTSDSNRVEPVSEFEASPHEIVVGLLGSVTVRDRLGELGGFQRSKTVELIAWLTTHRDRSTRSGARTALWELDVRDATFANVVSEARRALARLVAPPDGEEWVGRTLTDQLPLHELVVTDADLVEERLAHARLQPPHQALTTLRPAVELVRDMPFSGTEYLWPDAEGITSRLVMLAITASAEFAGHALSLGDADAVFWATAQGLRVLPGHEELISLRMRAHARTGDLAGVRQEWESYERVLVADAWSDGEPAPKLLALRRELLAPSTPQ